jgi:uncharacterized membrane protein
MSEIYLWLKWAHVVSSTVLFGMGAGIAFFFIRAQRTGDVQVIAAVGREVVIADAIFTASAVVLQPVTGLAMVRLAGYPLSLPWLRWSIALYVLIGCCWLPVVWLQVRMRNLGARAMQDGTALPRRGLLKINSSRRLDGSLRKSSASPVDRRRRYQFRATLENGS